MGLLQDALSPYYTVVEQGSTPANPASGNQKLFVRTSDHVLCLVNSSGTVTPLPAGFANPMTTKGDIIYEDATPTPNRLAIGTTTGAPLVVAAGLPAWGSLASLEYTPSGTTTMTTAGTEYTPTGITGTPAAGAYDIRARLGLQTANTNTDFFTVRLYKNSTVIDEAETDIPTTGIGNQVVMPLLLARASFNGSSDTVKITAIGFRNGTIIERDPANSSSGLHRQTLISLTQVG